jgi:hypothetical protein
MNFLKWFWMKEHKLIIKLKLDQRVKLKIMNKFFDQVKLVFQYYDQSKFCCDLLPKVKKFLFLM